MKQLLRCSFYGNLQKSSNPRCLTRLSFINKTAINFETKSKDKRVDTKGAYDATGISKGAQCPETTEDQGFGSSLKIDSGSTQTDKARVGKKAIKVTDDGEGKEDFIAFAGRILDMTSRSDSDRTGLDLTRITKGEVREVGPKEGVAIELSRLASRYHQDGPYLGAMKKDVAVYEVDDRRRRAIDRVPHVEPPYLPNETSFRRLPRDFRLPHESELRMLYPQSTSLKLSLGFAQIADGSAFSIDETPEPLQFVKFVPEGYDPSKTYPHMVVLADGRGLPVDFEDICANFFERPAVHKGLIEQQFVLLAPMINVKMSLYAEQEAIVARFCDWVCSNLNVEHGRVHLFGKGYGAYCALRTCLDYKNVALSCTAILGRAGTPFRPFTRAQERIKNLEGVHTLMYVPGFMRKQDWAYKFKFMMDYAQIRPAMRNIHYAEVFDHQIYYAINPYEFWNHLKYFRDYNMKMLQETGYTPNAGEGFYRNDTTTENKPAFTMDEICKEEMTVEEYEELLKKYSINSEPEKINPEELQDNQVDKRNSENSKVC